MTPSDCHILGRQIRLRRSAYDVLVDCNLILSRCGRSQSHTSISHCTTHHDCTDGNLFCDRKGPTSETFLAQNPSLAPSPPVVSCLKERAGPRPKYYRNSRDDHVIETIAGVLIVGAPFPQALSTRDVIHITSMEGRGHGACWRRERRLTRGKSWGYKDHARFCRDHLHISQKERSFNIRIALSISLHSSPRWVSSYGAICRARAL